MKINVKQVWDMELPSTMTLLQLKKLVEAIRADGDECALTSTGGNYIIRRIAG